MQVLPSFWESRVMRIDEHPTSQKLAIAFMANGFPVVIEKGTFEVGNYVKVRACHQPPNSSTVSYLELADYPES